jgi:predicted PurR-regulated permease PerM
MWISSFSTLLLPVLAAANVFHIAAPPVDFLVEVTVKTPSATAASVPTLSTPVPTTVSIKGVESFEYVKSTIPNLASPLPPVRTLVRL